MIEKRNKYIVKPVSLTFQQLNKANLAEAKPDWTGFRYLAGAVERDGLLGVCNVVGMPQVNSRSKSRISVMLTLGPMVSQFTRCEQQMTTTSSRGTGESRWKKEKNGKKNFLRDFSNVCDRQRARPDEHWRVVDLCSETLTTPPP